MQVEEIKLELVDANERNPNEMDDRTFNALCESLEEEGWVEPIQVVPIEDGRYQVVGGHHRVMAARVMGWETAPAVLLDPEKFDQDRRNWNLIKLNVLRGQLNPVKFTELYREMRKRYDDEVLQSLMGFTSEDAFSRLYIEVKKSLPPELQKAMEEVRDEIRTIDDLALVLNRLFREYGETLPSNMMVFSWGGREVMWVRCSDELWDEVSRLAKRVANEKLDMAKVLLELIGD